MIGPGAWSPRVRASIFSILKKLDVSERLSRDCNTRKTLDWLRENWTIINVSNLPLSLTLCFYCTSLLDEYVP